MQAKELFGLNPRNLIDNFLGSFKYVWQTLASIEDFIETNLNLIRKNYKTLDKKRNIFIHPTAKIHPNAHLEGPNIIIGSHTEVRPFAYIRKNVIIGSYCIIRSEVKNSIILNEVTAPHMSYIGDSILGNSVNLGANTVLSNIKFFSIFLEKTGIMKPETIKISYQNQLVDTHLVKFGAIIGDFSQTGCNITLNPGTIVPKYHVCCVRHGKLEIIPIEEFVPWRRC